MTATLAAERVAPAFALPHSRSAESTPVAKAARSRSGSRRRLVVGATVAVLTVEAVLAVPTMAGAATSLRGASLGWLAIAAVGAAGSMSMFARSRRRLMSAAGVQVPARDALAAVYVANAMHVTLPGGAAFSTAYTFRWLRIRGASPSVATWALASGGVVASAALAFLGLLGSMFAGGSSSPTSVAIEGGLVVLLCVGVRHLQRRPEAALSVARWVLARGNAVRRRSPTDGVDALEALVVQLRSVRPRGRDWAVAGAFAVGNWLFDVGCLAAAAIALGVHGLTLPLLLVAYTAGMGAQSLSLLPGGLGVVDAALVLTLVAGGIPAAAAVPAVLLYRLISLGGVVAAGWTVAAVQARGPRRSRLDENALVALS